MVTKEVMNLVENLYKDLDKLVDLIGLEYNFDQDDYVCLNKDQVDDGWCDKDMLRSIENAHTDIKYFLGK